MLCSTVLESVLLHLLHLSILLASDHAVLNCAHFFQPEWSRQLRIADANTLMVSSCSDFDVCAHSGIYVMMQLQVYILQYARCVQTVLCPTIAMASGPHDSTACV